MSTPTELDALARKTQQAYYEDGLADLFMGVLFLGLASLFTLIAHNIIIYVILILTLNPLFYGPLIEAAKRRWVYPRAGYVKPKPLDEPSTRKVLLALVPLLSIVILPPVIFFLISGFAGLFFWLTWIAPAMFGFLIALGFVLLARKYHITRYYLFALLLPVIGGIVPWLNLSVPTAYAAFFTTLALQTATIGLCALLSGTVLFVRFLHRYPVESIEPAEGENSNALL